MTDQLIIVGRSSDQAKLSALADRLSERSNVAQNVKAAIDIDEVGADHRTLFVWSPVSEERPNAALGDLAVTRELAGKYWGLAIEDAVPPTSLSNDRLLRLADWPDDDVSLTQLEEFLGCEPPVTPLLLVGQRLREIGDWMKRLNIWAKVTAFLGAIIIFLGLVADRNDLCSWPPLQPVCKAFGVSQPSEVEREAWAVAADSESCSAVESYLDQYGPRGHFADQARDRLSRRRDGVSQLSLTLPFSVLPSSEAFSTEQDAREEFIHRSQREGQAFCQNQSGNYEGLIGEATFMPSETVDCRWRGGGFRCSASGTVECTFRIGESGSHCPSE